jgi:uncharacterized phage protein (TIGR01671 family)
MNGSKAKVIKFRAWHIERKEYFQVINIDFESKDLDLHCDSGFLYDIPFSEVVLEQFTGLHDSEGKEIYENDILELRYPYRRYQTHYGENIPHPSGEYTEPLEPEIEIIKSHAIFHNGQFLLDYDREKNEEKMKVDGWYYAEPLYCHLNRSYDRNDLINIYDMRDGELWDDEEEGFLQYLLEWYPPNSEKELIEYLEAVLIVGNIHENKEITSGPEKKDTICQDCNHSIELKKDNDDPF